MYLLSAQLCNARLLGANNDYCSVTSDNELSISAPRTATQRPKSQGRVQDDIDWRKR